MLPNKFLCEVSHFRLDSSLPLFSLEKILFAYSLYFNLSIIDNSLHLILNKTFATENKKTSAVEKAEIAGI